MAGDQNKFKTAMIHAERFSEQGNWSEAIKAYRFALAEYPNNEAAIIGFARGNIAIGQNELAWKALQQALRVNPGNYEALTYLADMQEQMGQLDAAAETYLRVGNVFAGQGDTTSALEAWSRAIELVPDKIDAHQKLVQVFTQEGKTRSAARQLLTIAAIYQNRGDEQYALQQLQEAQTLLPDEQAIASAFTALKQGQPIQPDALDETLTPDLEIPSEFTEEYGQRDLFDEEDPFALDAEQVLSKPAFGGLLEATQQKAITELANVIFEDEQSLKTSIPREQVNLLIVQAIDLQTQEKLTEAVNNYRRVIQAGANRPALYFNLGMLYKQQGQYNEAAKMFNMSAQDRAYQISSQFALGETYYTANNYELALKNFLETLKIIDLKNVTGQKSRDLTLTYEKLMDSYLSQMDPQKIKNFVAAAQKFFTNSNWAEKATEARAQMDSVSEDGSTMSMAEFLETPETEVVITTMALTGEYIKRNLLMTASEECLRSIQKAPSYLPLHVRLADILLRQEHTEEAITKYLYISRVYLMRQQPDQAINLYQKVLRLAPMDVTVRSKLIELYISFHQEEAALEQYLILADSYYQLAQVDRALEKYNEALQLATRSGGADTWKVEILTRTGDIYNQRFDWARAATAMEELLKLNPNDERTQRQLIDLYYKQNKVSQAAKILDKLLSTYQRYNPLKALDLLKELSSIYSEDMFLRQRLAVAYAQNGMNREAIAEYDTLGEMQMENGLRPQAMQTIQAIINLGPDDVEGYRRLLAQLSGGTT